MANLNQDRDVSSEVSPEKAKKAEKKPKMKNFGVQCRMKSDEAETLRRKVIELKKLRRCDAANMSRIDKLNRKFNSEENILIVVKNWLKERYNEKQVKFLMAKPKKEELKEALETQGIEPGEIQPSSTSAIIAATMAKNGLTKIKTSPTKSPKAKPKREEHNEEEEALEPGEIQTPSTSTNIAATIAKTAIKQARASMTNMSLALEPGEIQTQATSTNIAATLAKNAINQARASMTNVPMNSESRRDMSNATAIEDEPLEPGEIRPP